MPAGAGANARPGTSCNQRLAKDFEATFASARAFVYAAMLLAQPVAKAS
jgi:hypothetical protein